MLTIGDFEKVPMPPRRRDERRILMSPKDPIAGLEDLEMYIFTTTWRRGESIIWGWEWRAVGGLIYSSVDNWGKPSEEHYNPESAAQAAIKSASYWADEERLSREEQEREAAKKKQEKLDNQFNRFLNS